MRGIAVALLHRNEGWRQLSDKLSVTPVAAIDDRHPVPGYPWFLQMSAISLEEPVRLVRTLTGSILGCGGWVLSRSTNDTGRLDLLFEFERHACLDIYTVLIASGIELSQDAHIRFTELCQCTRMGSQDRRTEIASVDLEIQTYSLREPRTELAVLKD
jgi:hypothetical protein